MPSGQGRTAYDAGIDGSLTERLRRNNPLPEGAVPVGAGLAVTAVATFGLFAICSRVLDPREYSALAVLWTLLFAVGNGVMQPLEQEVGRAVADRRARGVGPGPVVRRAAVIGIVFTALLVASGLIVRDWLTRQLYGYDTLFWSFLLGLLAFCIGHIVRGTLSSHGRFGAYGLFFGVDGLTRPAMAGLLAAAGVAAVGPFGLVIAAAPFVGVAAALRGQRGLLVDGPPAPWSELSVNLGWLLLGTGSIALLLNGGTLAVNELSSQGEEAAAGVFLNALVIARAPVFLFQAVLAALLPKLSRQLGAGEVEGFIHALRRLLVAVGGFGVVAVAGAALLGPPAIELLFGSEETLGAGDLALLAGGSIVYLLGVTLMQALIALNRHGHMALGALLGLVVFGVVTALGDDLFLRVELGLVAGTTAMTGWVGLFVARDIQRLRATEGPRVRHSS